MRELECRAWDKAFKKLLPVLQIDFYNKRVLMDNGEISDTDASFEMVVLEPFTGVLDDDLDKIFEGDIIKGTSYLYAYQLETGEQFDYCGAVVWNGFEYIVQDLKWSIIDGIRSKGSYDLSQTIHRNTFTRCTGKIIGNIHENPEMLEQICISEKGEKE